MKTKFLISVVFASFVSISVGQACLHFNNQYTGKITEDLKELFVFHENGQGHMVVRTTLRSKKFPSEVAWVLPVPSVPTKFEEVNGPFFQELASFFPSTLTKGEGAFGSTDGVKSSSGIRVHSKVEVGQYEIQTIEILKDNSSVELNSWLKKNKFNSMPEENQKSYLKKGAAFLAIRMKMDQPGEALIVSKPLHITYKANQIAIPLKFTHDQREFDLNIYVLSKKELKKDLSKMHLERAESKPYTNEGLHPFIDGMVGTNKGFITLYRGLKLNSDGKKLKNLKHDPTFLISDL